MKNESTKKMIYAGLLTALTFVATYTVKIPIPFTTGYVHLGDSMVFLTAFLLGGWFGALAAGVGSMLADIVGGYAIWAIPTLIIKTSMALLIGLALSAKSKKGKLLYISGIVLFWGLFIAVMKTILQKGLETKSGELVNTLGIDTVEQLTKMASTVQTELNIAALLLIIIVAIISYLLKTREKQVSWLFTLGMVGAGLCMVAGYYITEYILYGNYITPVISIPWNLAQFSMGFIIASLLAIPLKKLIKL